MKMPFLMGLFATALCVCVVVRTFAEEGIHERSLLIRFDLVYILHWAFTSFHLIVIITTNHSTAVATKKLKVKGGRPKFGH